MLNVKFADNETLFHAMQEAFNEQDVSALYMTHYDLANITDFTAMQWKEFLLDTRVAEAFQDELELITRIKIRSVIEHSDSMNNTAQAQLVNTLLSKSKKRDNKEGPTFVYCYIPLNSQEEAIHKGPIFGDDPFLKAAKRLESLKEQSE
jgi:hypothetical protein